MKYDTKEIPLALAAAKKWTYFSSKVVVTILATCSVCVFCVWSFWLLYVAILRQPSLH